MHGVQATPQMGVLEKYQWPIAKWASSHLAEWAWGLLLALSCKSRLVLLEASLRRAGGPVMLSRWSPQSPLSLLKVPLVVAGVCVGIPVVLRN